MDDLVMKLGHMDYRDALAANKYILEAKRHGDYHQQARAKTLSLALNRMSRLKREQIDKQAQKDLAGSQSDTKVDQADRDERKLELVMAEDAIMAQVYQQMFSEVKTGAEQEMDDLKKLHKKFDYYYDKDKMADKLPSRWYNVEELDEDGDLQYSTEFTDSADDLIYKRYKVQQFTLREKVADYHARIGHLQMQAGLHKAGSLGGDEEEEEAASDGRRQTPLQALAAATEE